MQAMTLFATVEQCRWPDYWWEWISSEETESAVDVDEHHDMQKKEKMLMMMKVDMKVKTQSDQLMKLASMHYCASLAAISP